MRPLRVLHVNTFELAGGASRAAHRLHEALRCEGVASRMLVMQRETAAPQVSQPLGRAARTARRFLEAASTYGMRLQHSPGNTVLHSLNLFPSGLARWINRSDCDVVHLHWLGSEMLSVEEIGRIRKPVCWTLHDLWPMCGAEHYDDLQSPGRYRQAYTRANRPPGHRGPDLDAWVWRRKARAWPRLPALEFVAPSQWIAGCAAESALLERYPCTVIPNALDTGVFRPLERAALREALGLDARKRYILFGASGVQEHRKGLHLLLAAVRQLAGDADFAASTELLLFGVEGQAGLPQLPLPARCLGVVADEAQLARIYTCADVFAAPSLQDNLPNTVAEALACGTPVVAFRTGGLPDLVTHRVSGWLAQPFSVDDFCAGLMHALARPELRAHARTGAVERLGRRRVAARHLEIYRRLAATSAGLAS